MSPIRSVPTLPEPGHPADPGPAPPPGRRTALVAGSVALGALVTSAVLHRLRRRNLLAPEAVPLALEAETGEMELMEGCIRFYHRPGTGVPLVLLHSLNAAASSFEMRPIFDRYAANTTRPIYAPDWLGFGRSERPPVHYAPGLFERQLRRFLSEHVREPSDVLALSLGAEYAAIVAHTLPYLVRRLALLCPTALSHQEESSTLQSTLVRLADTAGVFELFFDRLTRPETIHQFYQQNIFRDARAVPEALVRYACVTAGVHGAHHAPRYFVEGSLFTYARARHAYANLRVPTLLVTPASPAGLVQDFDRLSDVLARNPAYLCPTTVPSGLLPQWEAPDALFELLDDFMERTPTLESAMPPP